MTVCTVPLSQSGSPLSSGFTRYRGDDWDGSNILLFQYGTLVPGAGGAPPTVTPIDITAFQPVGVLLRKTPPTSSRSPRTAYELPYLFTVEAGTARIVDGPNGLFGFCPRSDVTSQMISEPDGTPPECASLFIAAKLLDSAQPPNLGTIAKPSILVLEA